MTEYDQSFAELSDLVDEAHRTVAGGDNPSPNIWAQVRSQVIATKSQENPQMSTIAMQAKPVSTPARSTISSPPLLSRFANVAAAVVLVSALVLSGWYAVTNLGPADGDNNNGIAFAPTGEMTESDACNVEPLTVDRVMEIVMNPGPFLENGAAGDPRPNENPSSPYNLDLYEADMWVHIPSNPLAVNHPDEAQFDEVGAIADAYLNCLLFGTLGQAWTFYSPVHIQQEILSEFPVFRTEEEVRASVEQRISQPAYLSDRVWNGLVTDYEPASISINPDYQLALSRTYSPGLFSEVMFFGISLVDADGAPLYLTNGTGAVLVGNPSYQIKVNVGKSAINGSWFVVPYFW